MQRAQSLFDTLTTHPPPAKDTMRLFLTPELLQRLQVEQVEQRKLDATKDLTAATGRGGVASVEETMLADSGQIFINVKAPADAKTLSPARASVRKLRLSLEMLQVGGCMAAGVTLKGAQDASAPSKPTFTCRSGMPLCK